MPTRWRQRSARPTAGRCSSARRLMDSLNAGPPSEPGAEITARERDVLVLVGAGQANKEIAAELHISERTVRTHVSSILYKLGLNSRTQAALWAVREGLVDVGANNADGAGA